MLLTYCNSNFKYKYNSFKEYFREQTLQYEIFVYKSKHRRFNSLFTFVNKAMFTFVTQENL